MEKLKYDALIVGGGIAGMQAGLDLADQGYKVLIVEKEPSIGGKMIKLSKVFPTLDCCSCITTPKMSAVAHHENIELHTYCEVKAITENEDGFVARILKKPRYVNDDTCTGCRLCEYACPIDIPASYDLNMGATRTIRVPFSTAVPQIAVLDIENCILCGKCEKACPVEGCIDFTQTPKEFEIETQTIILATGFETTPIDAKAEYGAGELRNVIDGLMMERLLAPTGPYGRIIRPGDGKEPDSIGYVQCAGSRDETLGVSYCSRVCCMYAIKQAMLISGSLPLADITIYYMDIRCFGKGYEQFYQNAKAMGVEFVKGKVASITEDDEQNPVVRVEMIEEGPQIVERTHDMVVLSVGMLPGDDPQPVFHVPISNDGFVTVTSPNSTPADTDRPGIFVAGTAGGPLDIVDSIITAGAAAIRAAAYIESQNHKHAEMEPAGKELELAHV
ncbi:MAG: FAD-binding protein [Anaerolineales bacterium]